MAEPIDHETISRLAQSVFKSEEQGFIRHLLYCWITRYTLMGQNPYGEAVLTSLAMLRFKRAIARLSNEELAKYGITNLEERDMYPGWTANITPMDLEIMSTRKNRATGEVYVPWRDGESPYNGYIEYTRKLLAKHA